MVTPRDLFAGTIVSEDEDTEGLEGAGQDGAAGSPKRALSGKRIVLFGILPILILGGGGAAVMFGGLLGGGGGEPAAHVEETAKPARPKHGHADDGSDEQGGTRKVAVFYDLPELLVNLNSTSRRPSFLKIRVSLELRRGSDVRRIEQLRPRIIDNFQVYLRELRIDDLRGSAGIYRLREELLARVNAAVYPARVEQVLFKEVLVQ